MALAAWIVMHHRRLCFWLVLGAMCSACSSDAVVAPDDDTPLRPPPGVYSVSGADATYGAFSGEAEIRAIGGGHFSVSQTHVWSDAAFEGYQMALAWAGEGDGEDPRIDVEVELATVGYVASYGELSREGQDPLPVVYRGTLERVSNDTWELTLTPDRSGYSIYLETWTWLGPTGKAPLWENLRTRTPMHGPPSEKTKQRLFGLYATFHQTDEVIGFIDREEFTAATHYAISDRTDFDFLQTNPDTVRVLQAAVDPVSLTEALRRNRAYGQTLAEKAAYFDAEMATHHLNPAGTYSFFYPEAEHPFAASWDGTIWTGLYAGSQALRYLTTSSPDAYANMLRAIDGLLLMYDIAPTPGDFARAVRVHRSDGDPRFVQGSDDYAAWDWIPGANNDMLKGYTIGFTWAWLAIERAGGDPRQDRMLEVIRSLSEDSPIGADDGSNEMQLQMMLWMMADDTDAQNRYREILRRVELYYSVATSGVINEFGTSDWSGNHLIIQGILTPLVISAQMGDPNVETFRDALTAVANKLSSAPLGLLEVVAGTLGHPENHKTLEDGLWVLREVPAPKLAHHIDHRIGPAFCMSPFPNLPWKLDWMTEDRSNSLFAYPVFENNANDVLWKERPFVYTGGESSVGVPGADFLFAYWFGRYYKTISSSM